MRIFRSPKDRKGLEDNEQKIYRAVPVITEEIKEHDRMESESAGGESVAEAEQTTEEAKATTKKAWKKKADTTV